MGMQLASTLLNLSFDKFSINNLPFSRQCTADRTVSILSHIPTFSTARLEQST